MEQRLCVCGCGNPITPHEGKGRPGRYASANCRKRAQRMREAHNDVTKIEGDGVPHSFLHTNPPARHCIATPNSLHVLQHKCEKTDLPLFPPQKEERWTGGKIVMITLKNR